VRTAPLIVHCSASLFMGQPERAQKLESKRSLAASDGLLRASVPSRLAVAVIARA
jgi:hypothetical protein